MGERQEDSLLLLPTERRLFPRLQAFFFSVAGRFSFGVGGYDNTTLHAFAHRDIHSHIRRRGRGNERKWYPLLHPSQTLEEQ